ncbi:MAG: type VI secretion system contractile sheath large subunit [Planctomycetes bacterium]|nr:type VI secretion system contractile sheath large subunit [Planctomycetota bacterium]
MAATAATQPERTPAEVHLESRLIDQVVQATPVTAGAAPSPLENFILEPAPAQALRLWLANFAPRRPLTRRAMVHQLSRDIAQIDELLSRQVNAIIHHERFQKLEASWRGLRYLVEQADVETGVKIKVLNASWKDLARDAERAVEFDQSQLFRKIYSEHFDTPGEEPFGVLIGDHEIRYRPSEDYPVDDLEVLKSISQVAAAAFAPFVASAHPAFLGLNSFSQLERLKNLPRLFDSAEYQKWRSFRESEDSRFVGLILPRVLMRLPYADDGSRRDGFRFREEVDGPDHSKYLWGNAAYAFGAVLIRAFIDCGWLAEIRGVKRDQEGGGLVTGLPAHSFGTDKPGIVPKSSTDFIVNEEMEKELGELGFISLCHCKDTEFSVFYGNQSVQKPKVYNELAATMNAKISTMLQYMLCVSRFSHYMKVRTRDKVGSLIEAHELENDLNNWITEYVTADDNAPPSVKAKYPLREAKIQVREREGAGSYLCTMHLLPHYQLDAVAATVTVKMAVEPRKST